MNNYLFRHSILGTTEMFPAETKEAAVDQLDAKTRGDHHSYILEMVEYDLGDPAGGLAPVLLNEAI